MNRFFVLKSVEHVGIMLTEGPDKKGSFYGRGFGANMGLSPLVTLWPAASLRNATEVPSLPEWVGKGVKVKRLAEDL